MNEEKINEVIRYCYPYVEQFWAANIIGILLDCDFRDAPEDAKEYLYNLGLQQGEDRKDEGIFIDGKKNVANANLIAAAPEMYDLVNLLASVLINAVDPSDFGKILNQQVLPVLRKARGENEPTK